jgi:acyl carrier protein
MLERTEGDVLAGVIDEIVKIRPDLGDQREHITAKSGLFFDQDSPRSALALDSMEALELLAALEDRFAMQLSDTGVRVMDLQTVGDVVDAVTKAG